MIENHSSEQPLIDRWQQIKSQIGQALIDSDRLDTDCQLIAVSKTKPVEMVACLAKQGQQHFAENYLQEAVGKITNMAQNYPNLPIIWHYIGHVQRNKTRDIAENFSWVHTVERDIIAKRLNDQRPDSLPPLNVLIQVNVDEEDSKSGCHIDDVPELVTQILNYPKLRLRGLMIIPAKQHSAEDNPFIRTQALFNHIVSDHSAMNEQSLKDWDTLSMGMTADMTEAICHGATMVRIGSAIFGNR